MNKPTRDDNKQYIILTSLAGQSNLFELNILTGDYWETAISENEAVGNGYSEIYKVNGKEKIAAIFIYENSLALFYNDIIMLNQKDLTAAITDGGFFKRRFGLKQDNDLIIDVVYYSPDVQTDVFYDVVSYLKMTPYEKRLAEMHKMSQFFLIQDRQERMAIANKPF